MGDSQSNGERAEDTHAHNEFSGRADGPVFQGRDFYGRIHIDAPAETSEDATRFYQRMQARLDAEEAEEARRKARQQAEIAERDRQRQETWNRKWDALVAERARMRKRMYVALWSIVASPVLFFVSPLIHPVLPLLFMVSFFVAIIAACGFLKDLIDQKKRQENHKRSH
jgi:hypothetical protein